MKQSIIVTPAYGRDYRSASAAREAFLSGKDFRLQATQDGPASGCYCSVRDFPPGTEVKLRFKRLAAITLFKL